MKPLDFAKSVATALGILAINVLISVAVLVVYSYLVAPGHDAAFYDAAAQRIAPWSSVVFGGPLFFVAAFALARRRPDRPPMVFAVSIFGVYAIIDLAALFSAGGVGAPPIALIGVVALSLGTKLVGALAGARSASPAPRTIPVM
jgi:hypothetical protein